MKVFKGKIWAALGSLMDHSNSKASSAATPTAAAAPVLDWRSRRHRGGGGAVHAGGGGGDDERHVHEILFLVSNAPGAITFLSRRITARLEAARAPPAAALRSLLLVHRLPAPATGTSSRTSAASGRPRPPHRRATVQLLAARRRGGGGGEYATATGTCSFLHGYSAYLEERMQWAINQSGNLEPTGRVLRRTTAATTTPRALPAAEALLVFSWP